MIDAPAGTGKTYTEKCIAARPRGEGKIVLVVAPTGIAVPQLPGRWTSHSMFNLPMDDKMASLCVCNIKAHTQRADLIRKSNIILWDELSMTHIYCVGALNRTLQDLMRNDNLFGGKAMLFPGDWRQTEPIVNDGSLTDTTAYAAVISSHLWNHITRLSLTKPQRDKQDSPYAAFVRAGGENKQPTTKMPDGTQLIPLNNRYQNEITSHFQLRCTTVIQRVGQFRISGHDRVRSEMEQQGNICYNKQCNGSIKRRNI